MIDVSEIDLDKLTTLELWELHYRVAAKLGHINPFKEQDFDCPAEWGSYDSGAARARMRSLV